MGPLGWASMTGHRLEPLAPGSLDAEQRALYDAIARGPRAAGPQAFRLVEDDGTLAGPFNAFLLQPQVGHALQELGAAIRYRIRLNDRAREIATLVVAAVQDSAFEWYAHEALGRHLGLTTDELEGLRAARFDVLADRHERLVAETTHALAVAGDLDDDQYGRAEADLGRPGVFELLTIVGYYEALALQLRVFRVPRPA
jgi:4-carboxymuconolactone decarboxylase